VQHQREQRERVSKEKTTMPPNITNVFVLMLENRSFDHMLGFSGITGTDAATGRPTRLNGLTGTESNSYNGTTYTVSQPADQNLPVDPGHEFADVVEQLCGPGVRYPRGGAYPPINLSGYAANYATSTSPYEGKAPLNALQTIMRGYSPSQLPVLNALASEFAVCDSWFSSLPGPTWPNRFFAHAASSCGLDDSPSSAQIGEWETFGLTFPNGTIFQALDRLPNTGGMAWRIYSGAGIFTLSPALSGVSKFDIGGLGDFFTRVRSPVYPWLYTFLEPNYGDSVGNTFSNGNSQHPMDGVTAGEALIKQVYEAIRSSPHWNTSLLIITWDEHGGFYDHVAPPAAVAPGDTSPGQGLNVNGFTFEQYGVRVPAVVVSPLIPRNVIDHRVYDHASIPATLEALYGLKPLTQRDARANNLLPLLSLGEARTDTPATLPEPASFGNVASGVPVPDCTPDPSAPLQASQQAFVTVTALHDMELSPPAARPAIQARVASITTVGQADRYTREVQAKSQAAAAVAAANEALVTATKTSLAATSKVAAGASPPPAAP
jgi:phospholipase C